MPASDVRTKPVPIKLDRVRHLRYDLNALVLLEEQFGSVEAALDAAQGRSVRAVRAFLYAGLAHEDPDLTLEQAGSLVGFADLPAVTEAILRALGASFPNPGEPPAQTPEAPGS